MEINGIEVFDHIPEGWRVIKNANMAPCGYRFISNNKSRWSNDYRHALVREELKGKENERKEGGWAINIG